MTKQFTLKQLFSIVDGRLSTSMGDVYDILNWLTSQNLSTILLPPASRWVTLKNPSWRQDAERKLQDIAKDCGGRENFESMMSHPAMDDIYEIEPLSAEDTEGFVEFVKKNLFT